MKHNFIHQLLFTFGFCLLAVWSAQAQLPYTESFDGSEWVAGTTNNGSPGTISTSWNRTPTPASSNYHWKVRDGASGSGSTGPNDSFDGTKYLHVEASSGGNGAVAILETPDITTTASSISISYYYHMYGSQMGRLVVDVFKNGAWIPTDSLVGQQQTSSGADWLERTFAVVNVTSPFKIRFRGVKNGAGSDFRGDMAIDALTITAATGCLAPTDLQTSSITNTTASFGWTENNSATSWTIEYGPTGFTQGSGTSQTVSTNPTTISGLSSTTTYDVYVRSNCGGSDQSGFAGPTTFTTACGTLTLPFTENFDGSTWSGTTAGSCWTIQAPDEPQFTWTITNGQTPSNNAGPNNDHTQGNSSGKYVFTEASNPASTNDITLLESNDIDVSGISGLQVDFWYHMFGSGMGKLALDVNVGGIWMPVDSSGRAAANRPSRCLEGADFYCSGIGQYC